MNIQSLLPGLGPFTVILHKDVRGTSVCWITSLPCRNPPMTFHPSEVKVKILHKGTRFSHPPLLFLQLTPLPPHGPAVPWTSQAHPHLEPSRGLSPQFDSLFPIIATGHHLCSVLKCYLLSAFPLLFLNGGHCIFLQYNTNCSSIDSTNNLHVLDL